MVLKDLKNFDKDEVFLAVSSLKEKLGVKNSQLLWPLRVAVSGKQFTPGGGVELCVLLGKEETILRIENAIKRLKQSLENQI